MQTIFSTFAGTLADVTLQNAARYALALAVLLATLVLLRPLLTPAKNSASLRVIATNKDRKLAKRATVTEDVWEIATSSKATSVSCKGAIRAIEFSDSIPTPEHVAATTVRAIVDPSYHGAQMAACRPKVAILLATANLEDVGRTRELLLQYEINLVLQKDCDVELLAKWRQQATVVIPPTMAIQPNRGCHVCHRDIAGKASQCSACKAIIYCSAACATKDWPEHKGICGALKIEIDRKSVV